jgi:hypothetical protein
MSLIKKSFTLFFTIIEPGFFFDDETLLQVAFYEMAHIICSCKGSFNEAEKYMFNVAVKNDYLKSNSLTDESYLL